MCYGRRLTAVDSAAATASAGTGQLRIRAIWEIHWTIFTVFMIAAVVCVLGAALVWRVPGSTDKPLVLQLLLAAGALLAIGTGFIFVWAARSDEIILDASSRKWSFVRRTWPCDSGCTDKPTEGGDMDNVVHVFATTRSRNQIERMTSSDIDEDEELTAGLLSDREAGHDPSATSSSTANGAVRADAKDTNDTNAESQPTQQRRRTIGAAVSWQSGPTGSGGFTSREHVPRALRNRSCTCRCRSKTICVRLRSGAVAPLLEGLACSWTALCCCSDHCGYLDVDTAVENIQQFIANKK